MDLEEIKQPLVKGMTQIRLKIVCKNKSKTETTNTTAHLPKLHKLITTA